MTLALAGKWWVLWKANGYRQRSGYSEGGRTASGWGDDRDILNFGEGRWLWDDGHNLPLKILAWRGISRGKDLCGQRCGDLGISWAWLGVGWIKASREKSWWEGGLGTGGGLCEVSVCLVARHIPVPRATQSTCIFELMCDLLIDKFYGYFSRQKIFMYIVLFMSLRF